MMRMRIESEKRSLLPDPPAAVLVGAVGFVSAAGAIEVAAEWKFQSQEFNLATS